MSTIEERVARGVACFDEKQPGWWKTRHIDLGMLDMSRPCLCVVGQLSPQGDFSDAIIDGWLDLTFDVAYEYGLLAVRGANHFISGPAADEIYRELDVEWRWVITERRAAA